MNYSQKFKLFNNLNQMSTKQKVYYVFAKEVRKEIKKMHPDWSASRINAETGRQWKELDQSYINIQIARNILDERRSQRQQFEVMFQRRYSEIEQIFNSCQYMDEIVLR